MDLKKEPNVSVEEAPTRRGDGQQTADGETHDADGAEAAAFSGDMDGRITSIVEGASGSSALIKAEESEWVTILTQSAAPDSYEKRVSLHESYSNLALHYESMGGYESAARLLKNALEQKDGQDLRHKLARVQAQSGDFDFIDSYERLLRSTRFDLRLTLEYCYFLERSELHDAALNILEKSLKSRIQIGARDDAADTKSLEGFLLLLQSNLNLDVQLNLEDYRQLILSYFPNSVVQEVAKATETPEATLVGTEMLETEEQFGLKDEAAAIARKTVFFGTHYPVPVSIGTIAILLVGMAIFRVSPALIEWLGTSACFLLMSFLLFEWLRAWQADRGNRLRAHRKVVRNAIIASGALLFLNYLGPKVIPGTGHFISLLAMRISSAILVAAIMWRALLAVKTVTLKFVTFSKEVTTRMTRRVFRRQIASLVLGTVRWFTLGTLLLLMSVAALARPLVAAFAVNQLLFLLATWRWAHLESRSEKRKLRESLVFLIAVLFAGLAYEQLALKSSAFEAVVTLNVDATLVLGVATTFALQITEIPASVIAICFALFGCLNFAPLVERAGIIGIIGIPWPALMVANIVLLLLVTVIVKARSGKAGKIETEPSEVIMGSKIVINGGQQGVVGHHAAAREVKQEANAFRAAIDLGQLAEELADVRRKLLPIAQTREQAVAIGEVASAESQARAGNHDQALSHLRKAGDWFWKAISQVGIGVTTAAAKQLLGL